MKRFLREITFWRAIAAIVLVTGLYATVVRFVWGLGASTNLSDEFPWGIWIGFDVLVGVGLAAGGFTITATVHLFNLERFRPIVRPAVVTAFLGYLLVMVGLLYDLGRPYRIWHPLIMWNPHSVMFEVAWCVTMYTTVLTLEFSPMVLERFKLHRALRIVHRITIPVVIAGVILSFLHQSSLGTLYVILPDKLHGLWYSPFLPLFFFFSAIAAGLSMVILESFMSARAFGRRLELDILQSLARVVVVMLALYTVAKLQDMWAREAFSLLTRPGPERFLFLVEMIFGVLIPMVLFALPGVRRNSAGLVCTALLVVLGFILNRLNVATTGLLAGMGTNYFPSWMELMITAMLVTLGFIAFRLAAKYLQVFPKAGEPAEIIPHAPAASRKHSPAQIALVGLAVVLVVGAITLDGYTPSSGTANAASADVFPAVAKAGLNLPAPLVIPTGEDSPGQVSFRHDTHVDVDDPSCGTCHASTFSILKRTAGRPFAYGEAMHEATRCGKCHNGTDAFEVEENCEACHTAE